MESGDFGIALMCGTEQVGDCLFGGNWENQLDQSDPFQSALSSMASSPAASTGAGGGLMMRELIGRLGSICNSGDISPQFSVKTGGVNSACNTSCYNTPLNSPPKMNLSAMESQMRGNLGNHPGLPPFSADPGFAERAARFSCFSGLNEQFQRSVPNSVLNNHPNSNNCGSDNKFPRENGDLKEESSVSEQIPGGNSSTVEVQKNGNVKKRKSAPRGKPKESPSTSGTDSKVVAENGESSAKRSKQDGGKGEGKEKAEGNGNGKTENNGNQKQNKENAKPAEPPKDYIHVRARRGQATDSHSLAERVRREKISERMKFLQDLVPGCNKVTGKAVMLDEIINYVQSLQRQVEFLSMKLATVNPRVDSKMEVMLSKDALQAHTSPSHIVFPMTPPQMQAFPFGRHLQQELPLHNSITATINTQFTMNQVAASLHQNLGTPLDRLVPGASEVKVPSVWEDDLQSIVQMGFSQNQLEGLHGQVKMEM